MGSKRFFLRPIGQYRTEKGRFWLHIDKPYRPALKHLDAFGHVIVSWWAHEHDNPESRKRTVTEIPYGGNLEAGVFACRSEYRPNPIALTVCQILSMDEKAGTVAVSYMDAFDGTPLLDLKGYFPVSDRVRDCTVPEWVKDWPEWFEDAYKLEEMFAKMFSQCDARGN
jgi:tRNA-Thr(GGU) m(6)t(6)A37 methyltransferase TsaA